MDYVFTVTRPGQPDNNDPRHHPDATATEMIRRATRHGLTLTADAATGTITLTAPERTIVITPAEPIPTPTPAQRRTILDIASGPRTPLVWERNARNVATLRHGGRKYGHRMRGSLWDAGLITGTGHPGTPAGLSLLAYLTIGAGQQGLAKHTANTQFAAALRTVYGPGATV